MVFINKIKIKCFFHYCYYYYFIKFIKIIMNFNIYCYCYYYCYQMRPSLIIHNCCIFHQFMINNTISNFCSNFNLPNYLQKIFNNFYIIVIIDFSETFMFETLHCSDFLLLYCFLLTLKFDY